MKKRVALMAYVYKAGIKSGHELSHPCKVYIAHAEGGRLAFFLIFHQLLIFGKRNGYLLRIYVDVKFVRHFFVHSKINKYKYKEERTNSRVLGLPRQACSLILQSTHLFALVSVLTQSFLTFVSRHLVSFLFLSARHSLNVLWLIIQFPFSDCKDTKFW